MGYAIKSAKSVDGQVKTLVDAACKGVRLTAEQLVTLLDVAEGTPTAEYVREKADGLSRTACKGRGFIHAQIGLDRLPCPENCRFCLFAACNKQAEDDGPFLVDLDDVIHAAKLFAAGGAHLISLMATASYPFAQLEKAVHLVHGAAPNVALMVNAADMDIDQAKRLREAGASVAYHALRLREGEITDIQPAARKATMRAIREAGLQLMTGVEPLFTQATSAEIAQAMCQVREFSPYCTGVCKLTKSEQADCSLSSASLERVRYVACVLRLAVGLSVPVGCAGAVAWVDAGCDPRGRGYATNDEMLRKKLVQARQDLERAGWVVPDKMPDDVWV